MKGSLECGEAGREAVWGRTRTLMEGELGKSMRTTAQAHEGGLWSPVAREVGYWGKPCRKRSTVPGQKAVVILSQVTQMEGSKYRKRPWGGELGQLVATEGDS